MVSLLLCYNCTLHTACSCWHAVGLCACSVHSALLAAMHLPSRSVAPLFHITSHAPVVWSAASLCARYMHTACCWPSRTSLHALPLCYSCTACVCTLRTVQCLQTCYLGACIHCNTAHIFCMPSGSAVACLTPAAVQCACDCRAWLLLLLQPEVSFSVCKMHALLLGIRRSGLLVCRAVWSAHTCMRYHAVSVLTTQLHGRSAYQFAHFRPAHELRTLGLCMNCARVLLFSADDRLRTCCVYTSRCGVFCRSRWTDLLCTILPLAFAAYLALACVFCVPCCRAKGHLWRRGVVG